MMSAPSDIIARKQCVIEYALAQAELLEAERALEDAITQLI
jgi:hypothetical protein